MISPLHLNDEREQLVVRLLAGCHCDVYTAAQLMRAEEESAEMHVEHIDEQVL